MIFNNNNNWLLDLLFANFIGLFLVSSREIIS